MLSIALISCNGNSEDDKDDSGNGSGGAKPCVEDVLSKDSLEDDGSVAAAAAKPHFGTAGLATDGSALQSHNIHNCDEEDYVRVNVGSTGFYSAKTSSVNGGLEAGLNLCLNQVSCPSSSVVPGPDKSTAIIYHLTAATDYYLRVRSWNNTTGAYQISVKNGVAATAITDTETANDTLAGSKGVTALTAGSGYSNGSLGTPTSDVEDYYTVSGLAASTVYLFAFHTAVTAARVCLQLWNVDPTNAGIGSAATAQGNAHLFFETQSTGNLYLQVKYCDSANIDPLNDYQIQIVQP